ncbi:Ig domain-containing protein [Deinococcus sp. Leaf326]|uniref:Ig domain-containing protein n=1 Tax=Deinococcus sp. Leaf326 TaxID=1736338 RepID=UPI000AC29BBB|nr:Ig domain-containing protein [Deinococcus sp. Leaf326]
MPPRVPCRRARHAALPLLLGAALLSGCGATTSGTSTGLSARTDPLTFAAASLPAAYVNEPFSASLTVAGGVGPYGYRVAGGTLPPGLRFSGGTLSGTPSARGAFQFTVEASDANLSNKVQTYTLNVNDLPPLSLEPTLPTGEIRGETRVPVMIKAPRSARAARVTWDLGPDVQVTRVQAAESGNPVFWRQQGQVLSLDLGFKTVPRAGARVALITVKPTKAVSLNSTLFWYESRDGAGKVLGEKQPPAPAQVTPETTPAVTPATPTVPASGTTPAQTTPAQTPPGTSPTDSSPLPSPSVAPAPLPTSDPATGTPTTPGTPVPTGPGTVPTTPTNPVTPPVGGQP